jgi:hypothetical protein
METIQNIGDTAHGCPAFAGTTGHTTTLNRFAARVMPVYSHLARLS